MLEFTLASSLGFIINKTNSKLKNELFSRLKENDVTPEQWAVMSCLWENEGVTPKELSDIIFKDKPNTNRILEKLQTKKLIIKKAHPANKRAFQIFLTDYGWALRDEMVSKVLQLLEEATKGIDIQKIEEMKQVLNTIYDNLK